MNHNKKFQPKSQSFNKNRETTDKNNLNAEINSGHKSVLDFLHDLILVVLILFLLLSVFFRAVVVSGPSMKNTLYDGDYLILLSSTFYRNPQRGDIIVVNKNSFDDGSPIIKRVIATEGQKVDIDFEAGVVFVDDIPLDEPYTLTPTNLREGMSFPLTVEEGCVFALGDNRNESKDSRSTEIGQIDNREIVGKVIFLMLPGTDGGKIERDFKRIGSVS